MVIAVLRCGEKWFFHSLYLADAERNSECRRVVSKTGCSKRIRNPSPFDVSARLQDLPRAANFCTITVASFCPPGDDNLGGASLLCNFRFSRGGENAVESTPFFLFIFRILIVVVVVLFF